MSKIEVEISDEDVRYIEEARVEFSMTQDQFMEAAIHEFLSMIRTPSEGEVPTPENE